MGPEEFAKGFWPGELFLDEAKHFYKAIGSGAFIRKHNTTSFLCTMMNPCSKDPLRAHAQASYKTGIKMNLKGEGFIHGGLYVMRTTGVAEWAFVEENMGDTCPIDEVRKAVQAA